MYFINFSEKKRLRKYRTQAMKISKKITGYLKFMCFFLKKLSINYHSINYICVFRNKTLTSIIRPLSTLFQIII